MKKSLYFTYYDLKNNYFYRTHLNVLKSVSILFNGVQLHFVMEISLQILGDIFFNVNLHQNSNQFHNLTNIDIHEKYHFLS